ncbi:hypothetical protein ACU610_02155 [Geodermatophilus sp. URMC 61]|uniref:hypothetical protein n=1 Tax=Geodermatophilus sp. URMC 61 TaxID=3423411 RepID=UPI00406C046C
MGHSRLLGTGGTTASRGGGDAGSVVTDAAAGPIRGALVPGALLLPHGTSAAALPPAFRTHR